MMTNSERLWFAAKRGGDQHGDRMLKDIDQAVSNQAALNHDGSCHEVVRATVECQKHLADDFQSNMVKKGKRSSAYKQAQLVWLMKTCRVRREWSTVEIFWKRAEVKFIHVYCEIQLQ